MILFAVAVAAAYEKRFKSGGKRLYARAGVSAFFAPSQAEAESVAIQFREELFPAGEDFKGHFSIASPIPEARLREWATVNGYVLASETVPRAEHEALKARYEALRRKRRGGREWESEGDDE